MLLWMVNQCANLLYGGTTLHSSKVFLFCFCLPGTGYPKVINLTVNGELVEGNVLKGVPQIAWCGGTPGKGVARLVYLFTLLTFYHFYLLK